MSEWKEFPLNELAQVIMGQSPPSGTYTEDEIGLPFLQGSAEFGAVHPSANLYCSDPLRVAPEGAILMSVRAPVGDMNIADRDYCIGRGLCGIVGSSADTSFLRQLLYMHRNGFNRLAQGSTFSAIGGFELKRYSLTVPDPNTQRTIARILGVMDGLIERTEALIAKQQQIKQGLLHDLFTRGVDAQGHLRPPHSEAPELYHEHPVAGMVPKEWRVSVVGDLIEQIEQGWSPNCESDPAASMEWGVLKTTAVTWDGFNADENKALPPHLLPRAQYQVRVNDVLMTRAGPNSRVGVVAYVASTPSRRLISDKLYRFNAKAELVMNEFLALALSSNLTQTHLSKFKTGLAESQTNISQAIVKRLHVVLPAKLEQEAIIKRSKCAEVRINVEKKQLAKLRLLKIGLMQDLLTGRVSVEGC